MLYNAHINKSVCLITLLSFSVSVFPLKANAYYLAPASFDQMYKLAEDGKVEALRASVRRGLNIDAMNRNGETGLCIAARKRDTYTYNAFRAAGANPRHPCTQNIPYYDNFISSSRAVPITYTTREAYSKIGNESYSVAPATWWILGGLAVGGGALALAGGGGGGGGGGSSSSGGDNNNNNEPFNSFGNSLASSGSVMFSTTGVNTNNSIHTLYNNNSKALENINFNKSTVNGSQFLNVGLKAENGGKFTNSNMGKLFTHDGTVAMAANNNASVINDGYINTEAKNATMVMAASLNSSVINNGKGIIDGSYTNGIDIKFTGNNEKDMVIGMYADSGSSAINNGDIKGTTIKSHEKPSEGNKPQESSSILGTVVGMHSMIINTGSNHFNTVSKLENNGNIKLSTGDSGNSSAEIRVNLVGMGNFLDDGFLNGSKDIKRAEKASLLNNGNIELSYTGSYTASDAALRKGLGGIIGIRADANALATNNGNIKIDMSGDKNNAGSKVAVAAGMQSVHGGKIKNEKNGNITINSNAENNRISYGMISVEGAGTVSGLYDTSNHSVSNAGSINMNTSNGYAMASYNGGQLINEKDAHIVLGGSSTSSRYQNNIGMFGSGSASRVDLINRGTIDIYSYNSIAMENDFAGNTSISNDGTINIFENAVGSKAFGGNYSQVVNNGTINYYTSAANSTKAANFDDSFTLSVNNSVITTKPTILSGETTSKSSETEKILNKGEINLFGSSHISAITVDSTQGSAVNGGTINLNKKIGTDNTINSVGMYLASNTDHSAKIINENLINVYTNYSAAMASDSKTTSLMNNYKGAKINIYGNNSYGMYATGNSYITNDGTINIYGDNSVGIYSAGTGEQQNSSSVFNNEIKIYGENAIAFVIKGKDVLKNIGRITVCSPGEPGCKPNARDTLTYFYVFNDFVLKDGISIDGGTLVKTGKDSSATNDEKNVITANKGTLFYGKGGQLINKGIMNILGKDSTAMKGEEGTNITNHEKGKINVSSDNSYGIYAGDKVTVANDGTITVSGNNSYGIFAGKDVSATNTGTITVSGNNSYGIYARKDASKVSNTGTIIATGNGSYAIFAELKGIAVNEEGGYIEGSVAKVEDKNDKNKSFLRAEKYGMIKNFGTIVYNDKLDFNESTDGTGIISVNNGGSYKATSLSGKVTAGADITQKGFATEYVNENSFVGKDEGLDIVSGSYMFNADKQLNDKGNIDVVMSMKSFDEVVSDKQIVDYLSSNYDSEKGEDVFNSLKDAQNAQEFDLAINQQLGFSIIPNIYKQNFDLLNNLNREISNEVFAVNDEQNRSVVKAYSYKQDIDNHQKSSGYDENVNAIYGILDTKIGENYRAGIGLAVARVESDFDDGSSRYNNVAEVFAPLSFHKNNLSAMVKPMLGFGFGRMRRVADDDTHKSNTKEFFYGIDTEVRQSIDTDIAVIEPSIGFNLDGIYMDDIDEDNKGLKIDAKNTISAHSVVGIDIKKKFAINDKQSLLLKAGGKYYHNFGDKYQTKATVDDMIGNYDIIDNRSQRNYGLFSLSAQYDYNNLSVSATANTPLEQNSNTYYLLGIGYKF